MLRQLEIRRNGTSQTVLTFLSEEELNTFGDLDPKAIVALVVESGEIKINATFREFLHEAIAVLAPLELASAAREAGNGRVVYIDDRAPEDAAPELEDIIGWFKVREGVVLAGAYQPNPEHKLHSTRGWSAAISRFREAMVRELATRCAAPPPAES